MSKHTLSHLHTNSTSTTVANTTEKARVSFLLPRHLVEEFKVAMIRRRTNASRWLREQMQAAIKAA